LLTLRLPLSTDFGNANSSTRGLPCTHAGGNGAPSARNADFVVTSRIIGLTGDPPTPEAIAKAFRVYAKKVPGEKSGDYTVDHTGVIYLMDRRGKFVSAFNLQRTPQQAARELEDRATHVCRVRSAVA
jgi:hypothetical protein